MPMEKETYRSIVEDAVDAIFIGNSKGDFIYINSSVSDLSGYSKDELLKMNMSDLFSEKHLSAKKLRYDLLEANETVLNERDLLKKDGSFVPVEMKSKKLPNGNYQCIMRDISERKNARLLLQENEHYFRTLLNQLNEDILVIDKNYIITDVNNKMLNTTGHTRKEAIGKHCYEISHSYHKPCSELGESCKLTDVFITGEPANCLHQHTKKNGKKLWVDILLSPLINMNGDVTHVIESARDITDIYETQEALRESENRYKMLSNLTFEGILLHINGVAIDINHSLEKLFGLERDAVIGKNVIDLFVADDYKEIVKENLIRNYAGPYEINAVTAGGKIIPVEIESKNIEYRGKPIRATAVRDITKRKEAEIKLRESEEKYKLAAASGKIVTWWVKLPGSHVESGGALEKLLGYNEGEIEDWFDVIPEEEHSRLITFWQEIGAGKTGRYDVEHRMIHKNGNIIWVLIRGEVLFDDAGKPIEVIGTTQDITKRKQSEEALKESEEKYNSIFSNVPLSICLVDEKGFYIDINPYHVNHIGRGKTSKDDYIGKNILDRPSVIAADLVEEYKKVLSGTPINLNAVYFPYTSGKNDSYFNIKGVPLYESNKQIGAIFVHEDVTQLKKTDLALHESEIKFRDLTEKSLVGVYLIVDGIFKYVNPKLAEIFGYSVDEITEKLSPQSLVYKDDWSLVKKNLQKRIAGEIDSIHYQFRGSKKDGSIVHVDIYGSRITHEGKPAVIGTLMDITEQYKVQKVLEESEKKYKSLIKFSPVGMVILREGKIIYANPVLLNTLGFHSEKQLIGTPILKFVHPDYFEQAKSRLSKLKNKTSFITDAMEEKFIRKDKKIIDVLVVGQNIEYEGSPAIQGYIFDITETKKAERELHESEERFRNVFFTSPDPMSISRLDNGKYVDVNDSFLGITGYTRNEMIGKSSLDLEMWYDKNDRGKIAKLLADSGSVKNLEVKFKLKDGSIRSGLVSGTVINIGGIPHAFFTTKDIEEIKQAQKSLKESEERYRQLFENSPVPLWEEDFTELYNYLMELKRKGFKINKKFMNENPEVIRTCIKKIKTLNINNSVLYLLQTENKDEVIKNYKKLFTDNSRENFKKQIIAIAAGKRFFESETETLTFKNEIKHINLRLILRKKTDGNGNKVTSLLSTADITEQKKAEEELTKLTLRYEALLDADPDILMEVDNNKVYTWSNKAGYDFFGNDVVGKEASFYFISEQGTYETVQPLFEGSEKVIYVESWQKRLDGKKRLLAWWCRALKDADGKVTGTLSTARDITEIRKAQDELKDREQRYRALFDMSPSGIVLEDKAGNIIDINPSLSQTFNYKREELIGKNIRLLTHPDNINSVDENINRVLAGENLKHIEKSIKKDGTECYVELNETSIELPGLGKGLLSISSDITDRIKMEKILRENEERFRSIMKAAPVGMGLVKNRILEYVNVYLCNLLGYSSEEMIGKSSKHFYASKKEFNRVTSLYSKLDSNETASTEVKIKHKSGRILTVIIGLCSIDPSDSERGQVFSVLDITKRIKLEEKIKSEETRYKNLFDNSPVPLWEEDFTELFSKFDELKEKGVSDLRKYFKLNPESVYDFISLPKVLNVNQACLNLHNAKKKEDLLDGLQNIFTENSLLIFIEELIAIFNGKKLFEAEAEVKTLDNKTKYVNIQLHLDYGLSPNSKNRKALLATYDITDRITSEKKRMELEISYQDIFDNASDAIYVQDTEGKFIDINKGAVKMYGYQKEEFLNKTPEFLSAEGKNDLNIISNYIKDAFNNIPGQFEFWGKKKNGEIFPKLVRIRKGSYLGKDVVVAFALDITELKAAEEALKKSEINLKEAQKIAKIGHWELDLANNNLYWSDEVYRIFNLKPQKFGATYDAFLDNVHPEDREEVNKKFAEAIQNKTTYNMIHRLKPKKGLIKYVREIGQTFYDESGKALRSIGTVQDVTEIILAENEIKAQLEKNQVILNTTNDGFILADDKGMIIDVNPAYCKLIGYSADELRTMDIRDIEVALQKNEVDARIKRMIEKGHDTFETRHKTKSGKIIDLSVSVSVADNEDKPLVAAFVRDITLQKEALEKLKKSKEVISDLAQHIQNIREEERTRIAREIHDDLGQSLTALKIDLTWVDENIGKDDKTAKNKIHDMYGLIDSTIKSAQTISSDLRPGILDDLGLIAAIEWQLDQFQEKTEIKTACKISPEHFNLDEKISLVLFRVFQEALTNVYRHAKAKNVKVKLALSKNNIILELEDNGIGITDDKILSSNSLGLIGMKERIAQFNGNLSISGKKNKGTRLVISIPV